MSQTPSYGANKKFSYLQAQIDGFQDQCRGGGGAESVDTGAEKLSGGL